MILLIPLLLLLAALYVRYWTFTQDIFQRLGVETLRKRSVWERILALFKQHIFHDIVKVYSSNKEAKVIGLYFPFGPTLLIRDLDIYKDITVKYFDNFANRGMIGVDEINTLPQMRGAHWKHVRNIVSPNFSSAQIKRMSQGIEKNAQRLVNVLRNKQLSNEHVQLRDVTNNFTLDTIASTSYGLDINSLENPKSPFATHIRNAMNRVFLSTNLTCIHPLLSKLIKGLYGSKSFVFILDTINSALEDKRQQHRAEDRNDLLDNLVKTEHVQKGSLTKAEIEGQALQFFMAAYETTSTALSFTLFLLAVHPEHCQMVQKEIDEKIANESPNYNNVQGLIYMDMCINESLRLFPPFPVTDRVCTDDTTIQGIQIPKGMIIMFFTYAVHHDREIWPEPEKFKPERFSPENKDSRHPCAFLPFGQGPRNCIGKRLALVELKLALAYVLKTLTPVPCENTVYPVKLSRFNMDSADGLWVKFKLRT